jgi:hypothetical protein
VGTGVGEGDGSDVGKEEGTEVGLKSMQYLQVLSHRPALRQVGQKEVEQ